MKRKSMLVLFILVFFIMNFSPCFSAGPVGHAVIAHRVIASILAGKTEAPPDLKEVLEDPDCRRAFAGGAIGPDIIEAKTHYGDTSKVVRDLLSRARSDLNKANASGDSVKIQEAKEELSFAYGWLSHLAVDLDVHPKVNQVAGDAYQYCNKRQKIMHAAKEVHLDYYLWKNFRKPEEIYDIKVPIKMLSEVLDVPENEVKFKLKVLNAKVVGELLWKQQVELSDEKLRDIWLNIVKNSHQDSISFIEKPDRFKSWDLDVGRMTTEEFKDLRELVIRLNKGELPAEWGKKYLEWHSKTKNLSSKEKEEVLAKLIREGKQDEKPLMPSMGETTWD